MMSVPGARAVVAGARVNIVLKPDQRTGRTVSGTVRDVLTRGDHHRGIKVRLVDGRIGRVQSLVAPSLAQTTSASSPGSQCDGIAQDMSTLSVASDERRAPQRGPWGHRSQNWEDEQQGAVTQTVGLDAYIKPARRGKGKATTARSDEAAEGTGVLRSADDASGSGSQPGGLDSKAANATCPVCGAFEGDEAAVAHHVATHFDS
jgi:uncharacterized repeat protein (TIGR03833 family)